MVGKEETPWSRCAMLSCENDATVLLVLPMPRFSDTVRRCDSPPPWLNLGSKMLLRKLGNTDELEEEEDNDGCLLKDVGPGPPSEKVSCGCAPKEPNTECERVQDSNHNHAQATRRK